MEDEILCKSSAKRLCSYIPYFESIDPDKACKWITPAGTVAMAGNYRYEDKILKFEEDFYNSDLVDYAYMETIEKRIPDAYTTDICKIIETADLEVMKAILTKCMRQERFCDGVWVGYIKDGIFLSILQRLDALLLTEK